MFRIPSVVEERAATPHQLAVRAEDGSALAGHQRFPFLEADANQCPPNVPTFFPPTAANTDWQASSITGMPCFSARAIMCRISTGNPFRCTGRIAFVCSVMEASICSASIDPVSASISTKTGRACQFVIVLIVAMKVLGVVITSSPAPTPAQKSEALRGRRTSIRKQAALRAHGVRERLLEVVHPVPAQAAPVAAVENVEYRLLLVLVVDRPGLGKRISSYRSAPQKRELVRRGHDAGTRKTGSGKSRNGTHEGRRRFEKCAASELVVHVT